MVALTALATAGGGVAIHQRNLAREAGRVAEARELALLGVASRVTEPYAAVALGAAAERIHADDQTRAALAETVIAGRQAGFRGTSVVAAMAMSADGQTALIADQNLGVALWDLSPSGGPGLHLGSVRAGVLESRAAVRAVALSTDGRIALLGHDDDTASLWDTADHDRPVRTATLEGGPARQAVLSADRKTTLLGYENGSVGVWDIAVPARPALAATLAGDGSDLRGLGLSADGRTAVTLSGRAATVWDLSDRARPVRHRSLDRGDTASAGVAVTSDGRIALVGSELWDVSEAASPRRLGALPGLRKAVSSAALTPDGSRAVTAETDGRTVLWDLEDRARPSLMTVLKAPVTHLDEVALSADGRIALVATAAAGVLSWDLTGITGDPLHDACGRDGRLPITRARWNDLTDGEPWPDSFGDGDSFDPCA
ncbi:WD40 repeat domain-containing protein [Nonomuraea pusilla]|uniref:WD40 repeat domain-containing protein n=1 Tax=Nonomuraea pusilla TaxID=46177 RepID=UPI00333360F2